MKSQGQLALSYLTFQLGYDTTVLNLIASDFTLLEGLSPEAAIQQLLTDFFRYFPGLSRDDILKLDFQSHIPEPLFMNNVGGWAFRPSASTKVPNLYLAGDYCRSAYRSGIDGGCDNHRPSRCSSDMRAGFAPKCRRNSCSSNLSGVAVTYW